MRMRLVVYVTGIAYPFCTSANFAIRIHIDWALHIIYVYVIGQVAQLLISGQVYSKLFRGKVL